MAKAEGFQTLAHANFVAQFRYHAWISGSLFCSASLFATAANGWGVATQSFTIDCLDPY